MSSYNAYFSKYFQTPTSEAEKQEQLQAYNNHKHLISTLPSHNGLRNYRGFCFKDENLLMLMSCHRHFEARPTDIFLATYPKSGTTWLKALAFAILNRRQHPPFSDIVHDHPLLTIHPQECLPHLEELFATCQVPDLSSISPPRVFGTHFPYSLLPDSVKQSSCRIVYLCRDPKDVLVSLWHFMKDIRRRAEQGEAAFQGLTLEQLTDRFCDGMAGYGSVWDHRMEYWRESQKHPDKVLFLEYEDMSQRPEENARRLAEFFGRPFSDKEEEAGVVADIVKLCSIEFLKGLEVNREGVMQGCAQWVAKKSAFFRNGKAGGWKEELSPEIAERLDRITREKMEGSGNGP